MLEATTDGTVTLKRLLDVLKNLVVDAEFECNEGGLNFQAMDYSQVALVSVKLHADSFALYRCDHSTFISVNLSSVRMVFECAKDDDRCTIKVSNSDILSFTFESHCGSRVAEYAMRPTDSNIDTFNIPDVNYDARITMASAEFTHVIRDFSLGGEFVRIEASKEGVCFVHNSEATQVAILLKQTDAARERYKNYGQTKTEDKQEPNDSEKNKRKRAAASSSAKLKKKAKKVVNSSVIGGTSGGVHITVTQQVSLTFLLKYLVNFSGAAQLSDTVQLMLKAETPLLLSYTFEQGHIRYHLAQDW